MNHYNDPYDDPKKPITAFGYEGLHDKNEAAHQAKQEDDGKVDMTDWEDFN